MYLILRIGPFVAAEWNFKYAIIKPEFSFNLFFVKKCVFIFVVDVYIMFLIVKFDFVKQRDTCLATLCACYRFPNRQRAL